MVRDTYEPLPWFMIHMNITLLFWCTHNIVIISIIVVITSMIYRGALFSVSPNPTSNQCGAFRVCEGNSWACDAHTTTALTTDLCGACPNN